MRIGEDLYIFSGAPAVPELPNPAVSSRQSSSDSIVKKSNRKRLRIDED